jgi:hypothetical protein
MKRIIENEIYRLIKRFPTVDEYRSANNYLEYMADDDTNDDDLRELLTDWRDECMHQCEHCGKWQLVDQMLEVYGTYYCDEVCKHDHDAFTYDMSQMEQNEYKFNVING